MSDATEILMERHILEDIFCFYEEELSKLPPSHIAYSYLRERGISLVESYQNRLGYAKGEGLEKYLRSKGYSRNVMMKTGCFAEGFLERWGERVVFPCLMNGRVMGATARSIDVNIDKRYKYMNLKGNKWNFYSPDNLKSVKPDEYIFIAEGVFDVLTLRKLGFCAICFMGTNGWKNKYKNILYSALLKSKGIICFPDFDGNEVAYGANLKTYMKMTKSLGFSSDSSSIPIWVLTIDRGEGKMKDINEIFLHERRRNPSLSHTIERTKRFLLNGDMRRISEFPLFHLQNDEGKKEKKIASVGFPAGTLAAILSHLGASITRLSTGEDRAYCHCINPRHRDSNPSCCLYLESNTFYCFGCGKHGGLIYAVQLLKECSKAEALNYIQEIM